MNEKNYYKQYDKWIIECENNTCWHLLYLLELNKTHA